jgi:hypothetical protein
MSNRQLVFYVLVHEHEYGQTLYGFYYEPTQARPYPSVLQVAKRLNVDYEPNLDERVSLHNIDGGEPDLVLRAAEVGSHSPEFLDISD